jgi:hypothetical protein
MHRATNEFKRGYQLRSNLVKDENGHLLADNYIKHLIILWQHEEYSEC